MSQGKGQPPDFPIEEHEHSPFDGIFGSCAIHIVTSRSGVRTTHCKPDGHVLLATIVVCVKIARVILLLA
jgi:hypothetical protein